MSSTCARCHADVPDSAEHPRCPSCGAEAGLEPEHETSGPMVMFGALMLSVVIVTVASALLSWGLG